VCTARIVGTPEYDHVVPAAIGGSATLENCAVVCRGCHRLKTTVRDVPEIARSRRSHEKRIGARPASPVLRLEGVRWSTDF
jgi:5-methylcytosine-specific restriction endonuclease McrA